MSLDCLDNVLQYTLPKSYTIEFLTVGVAFIKFFTKIEEIILFMVK